MSKRSDLLKSIIKKPVGEKPTFGTNPRDPWSTKANIDEDAILNTFLTNGIKIEKSLLKNIRITYLIF